MTPILNPDDVAVKVIQKDGAYTVEDIPDLVFDNCANPKGNGPKYKVRFNVLNPEGSDYRFDSRKHPFEVENKVPPTKKGKPAKDICWVDQVTHQGETLIVINDNIDVRTLKYTLHLVSKSGLEPITYDPIMTNQNGGGSVEQRSLAVVGGILAVTALVAGLVLITNLFRDAADD